jgi:hypothetical protein
MTGNQALFLANIAGFVHGLKNPIFGLHGQQTASLVNRLSSLSSAVAVCLSIVYICNTNQQDIG